MRRTRRLQKALRAVWGDNRLTAVPRGPADSATDWAASHPGTPPPLPPSHYQVMMAGALGVYLAPGGGGYDVNLPRPEGERLAALASIASVAVLRPELLKAQLPASVVLSWNAGQCARSYKRRRLALLRSPWPPSTHEAPMAG